MISLVAGRATAGESHAGLRALALAGQGTHVRSAVAQLLGIDASEAEKAALLEILAVADAWSGTGSPAAIDVAMTELPEDAGAALDIVRSEVVRGAYAVAIVHLEPLRSSAPNLVSAARALELRELASAALRAHRPPVVVPPQTADDDDESEPATERKWYGWQTLITDGASVLATPFLPVVGLGGYALGGPSVHLAHGRPGIAAASLGLRVGAPLLGGVTGAVIAWRECGSCELVGAIYGVIGAGVGAVAAVTIDAAVLGRESVAAKPKKTSASLGPTAGPRREGGFDVGLVGTW